MDRATFIKLLSAIPFGMIALDKRYDELVLKHHHGPVVWGEGESNPRLSSLETFPVVAQNKIEIGFANAAPLFPVLKTLNSAVKRIQPADNPIVEWPGGFNYCQIVRTPFGVTNTELATPIGPDLMQQKRIENLYLHLTDVNWVLENGERHNEDWRRTCGGMRELGPGKPVLRPLRDLALLTNRQEHDRDVYEEEFISEFSLEVI